MILQTYLKFIYLKTIWKGKTYHTLTQNANDKGRSMIAKILFYYNDTKRNSQQQTSICNNGRQMYTGIASENIFVSHFLFLSYRYMLQKYSGKYFTFLSYFFTHFTFVCVSALLRLFSLLTHQSRTVFSFSDTIIYRLSLCCNIRCVIFVNHFLFAR